MSEIKFRDSDTVQCHELELFDVLELFELIVEIPNSSSAENKYFWKAGTVTSILGVIFHEIPMITVLYYFVVKVRYYALNQPQRINWGPSMKIYTTGAPFTLRSQSPDLIFFSIFQF